MLQDPVRGCSYQSSRLKAAQRTLPSSVGHVRELQSNNATYAKCENILFMHRKICSQAVCGDVTGCIAHRCSLRALRPVARSQAYDPVHSRLCTDDNSPGVKRQKIHHLEVAATCTVVKTWLGAKSGQKTASVYYCYETKDSFFEEKYRAQFASVMKELM
jgi:hypothetical protein